ncbi:hypothetical protein F5050DRAFT_1713081 [Lentinula boryana]|uniref:Uncharacterized protein n=1 Tax=Lentinula boryana TaxID=40481 RepID=A0ABQ8Q9M7_9AGAR|nr:hypothetical protein F5050DRAFT_1713081 [Lentinula boryana]
MDIFIDYRWPHSKHIEERHQTCLSLTSEFIVILSCYSLIKPSWIPLSVTVGVQYENTGAVGACSISSGLGHCIGTSMETHIFHYLQSRRPHLESFPGDRLKIAALASTTLVPLTRLGMGLATMYFRWTVGIMLDVVFLFVTPVLSPSAKHIVGVMHGKGEKGPPPFALKVWIAFGYVRDSSYSSNDKRLRAAGRNNARALVASLQHTTHTGHIIAAPNTVIVTTRPEEEEEVEVDGTAEVTNDVSVLVLWAVSVLTLVVESEVEGSVVVDVDVDADSLSGELVDDEMDEAEVTVVTEVIIVEVPEPVDEPDVEEPKVVVNEVSAVVREVTEVVLVI